MLTEISCQKSDAYRARSVSMDVIKLLSAFMVVFYHFGKMDLGTFSDGIYKISLEQLCLCLCSASIPLFFMVNGAFLFNKEYTVNSIYSKAAKLALLVFVWQIVDFPSWFLKTLCVLYLIYPILNKTDKAKNKIWRNIIMCLVLLFPFMYNFIMVCIECWRPDFSFSVFNRIITLQDLPLRTGVFTMYSILYFLLGGLLFRHKINNIISAISAVIGYILVVFDVIVSSNYNAAVSDAVNACFPTLGSLMLSFGLFNLIRNLDNITNVKFKKTVAALGKGVLPIYLFHLAVIQIIQPLLLSQKYYGIPVVLLLSVLTCIICYLIGLLLQKIPLVKELVKI